MIGVFGKASLISLKGDQNDFENLVTARHLQGPSLPFTRFTSSILQSSFTLRCISLTLLHSSYFFLVFLPSATILVRVS